MRLYSFTNMYISDIQKGIQTAHVISEMSIKYFSEDPLAAAYNNWAKDHKTIIVLNGGYEENLYTLEDLFKTQDKYPWAAFNEEKAALNGARTAIGIVLPEEIYTLAGVLRGFKGLNKIDNLYISWNKIKQGKNLSQTEMWLEGSVHDFLDNGYDYTEQDFEIMLEMNKYGLA